MRVCTGFKWLKTDANEHGTVTLGSINGRKLLDKLTGSKLFKDCSMSYI
jgi:hypothetical protein